MDMVSKAIGVIVIIRRPPGLYSTNFVIDWDVRGQPPKGPHQHDHRLRVLRYRQYSREGTRPVC
jgi:hypothetical protein